LEDIMTVAAFANIQSSEILGTIHHSQGGATDGNYRIQAILSRGFVEAVGPLSQNRCGQQRIVQYNHSRS
jgi:hypothetical protein